MKHIKCLTALLCAVLLILCAAASPAETTEYAGTLVIDRGMAQPMLTWSDYRDEAYDNAASDILRFTVYVETDHDTDGDGMADLVKVFLQVPRAAVEGSYQAAVIYDPTPYAPGTFTYPETYTEAFYNEETFDYEELYEPGSKRTVTGEVSTLEHALSQDASEWNYTVPESDNPGYGYGQMYDYYLIRGFAVAEAGGIGTLGSEGYELCGFDLERDAHRCVVEWLAGNRVAYTDRTGTTEIRADWSNGRVAATGISYGGTMAYELATTGVEGLETIIPYAGIASWYDYTNAQGVAKHFSVNYADSLAAFNGGAALIANGELVYNARYGSWLYTVAMDEAETNGKYAPIWAALDYSDDYEEIRCSALVVQGLNDFNVTSRQADLMVRAFEKAGQKCSLVLHQDGHNNFSGQLLNGELWEEIVNEWLCHYLYGVENGIEALPAVMAQSNVDGTYASYDAWRDFTYEEVPVLYEDETTEITTEGFMDFVNAYVMDEEQETLQDVLILQLPEANAAVYDLDVPEGTVIYGVPTVSFFASTTKESFEGLMISAALVDTIDGETTFEAYMTLPELDNTLPADDIGYYEMGGGLDPGFVYQYVQCATPSKVLTYGWTDLACTDSREPSSTYTEVTQLVAGQEYSYTFYMMPTVYTVQPGHTLKLVLYTWDPWTNALLDESADAEDPEAAKEYYNYSYTVNNATLRVELPVAP